VNSLGIRPPFGNDSTVERGYGDTLGKHYEMDTAMKQDREMAEDIRFGSCVTRIEDRRSKRRRATVREMKEGPSGSAIRC